MYLAWISLSTFLRVIVNTWLMRGFRRLYGIQAGITVAGRLFVHRSCLLAGGSSPCVARENVGRVRQRFPEIGFFPNFSRTVPYHTE